jgi:hypothetical protein
MRNAGFSQRCRSRNSYAMLHAVRHDKGLLTLRRNLGLLALKIKMEALLSFETPVTIQQSTRRNRPERQSHVVAFSPKTRPRPPFHKTLLGAFAKLRKATISFVMSVRPSVRLEQLGFHWTEFNDI